MELDHKHGKARVRVARVWRGSPEKIVEWNVSVVLNSHSLAAYTHGDNSAIVATDTIKNTVYVIAKQCKEPLSVEQFGILLARHFLSLYSEVTGVKVNIVENPWQRVEIDGVPHHHGFKLGLEKHTAEVSIHDGIQKVASGVVGLSLLKTTKSGFEGFIRDRYTLLPEVRERILASTISASWSYSSEGCSYNKIYSEVLNTLVKTFFGPPTIGVYSPSVQNTLFLMAQEVLRRFSEIESIHLNMPNLHFLPVNMPALDEKFEHDVYLPTDEPHGTIEATLTRKNTTLPSKL
ncbi:hypothetical protein O6H91_08G088900 [Diphasiastrum complanatum]|uniref:Uncharacterized protein n=1 Tax=Diphasiastrum complanatum TaxID=34168 RepID=A0ACC2CZT8_DIPCM|nr:hypothetical protein O6H91_08G088900 [Diphasiastrum complanatum]